MLCNKVYKYLAYNSYTKPKNLSLTNTGILKSYE